MRLSFKALAEVYNWNDDVMALRNLADTLSNLAEELNVMAMQRESEELK